MVVAPVDQAAPALGRKLVRRAIVKVVRVKGLVIRAPAAQVAKVAAGVSGRFPVARLKVVVRSRDVANKAVPALARCSPRPTSTSNA